MIKNEQSSAVYGLFHDIDFEGRFLLGLYFLEGEAEAAREAYIAAEIAKHPSLEGTAEVLDYLRHGVVVRHLAMGQVPSFNFAA